MHAWIIEFLDVLFWTLFITLTVGFAITFASLLATLKAVCLGRYLNRLYIVSKKQAGVYELHCQPIFGFYYATDRQFHRLTAEAISRFKIGYPNMTLIGKTVSQVSRNRPGRPINTNGFLLVTIRAGTYFLILLNLANYRRVNGKLKLVETIKRVHRTIPMEYTL